MYLCGQKSSIKISPYQTRVITGCLWKQLGIPTPWWVICKSPLIHFNTFWCSVLLMFIFSVILGHFPNESLSPQLNRLQNLSMGKYAKSFYSHQAPHNLIQLTTVIHKLNQVHLLSQRYHHFVLLPSYFLCFKVEVDRIYLN